MRNTLHTIVLSQRFVPFAFFSFMALRLAVVLFVPVAPTSDAAWYFEAAKNIADGQGYVDGGRPTAYWPVGYPAALAAAIWLVGPVPLAGQLLNLVASAGTFFLVLALGRRLFRDEMTARVSVLVLAFYPNSIAYNALLLTETLFTFLILFGVWALSGARRWGGYVFAGIVLGYACLTKPQVILLPAIVIFLANTYEPRRMLQRLATVYAAAALVLIPWAARNTSVFGEVVLVSTNGGATLLTGNNPSAKGGFMEDDDLVRQRKFSVEDQVAADKRAKDLAVNWIKENPGRFLALMPLKALQLWLVDGEGEWGFQSGYAGYERSSALFRAVRWGNQLYYAMILLGTLVAVLAIRDVKTKSEWPLSLFGLLFAIYLTAIAVVFSGQSRFHFPVMPWLIMYAAFALSKSCSSIRNAAPSKEIGRADVRERLV